jgi:hypothetical protein
LAGVHKITSSQPAIRAGIPSISTVENKGAVPPGNIQTYFAYGYTLAPANYTGLGFCLLNLLLLNFMKL